MLTVVFASFMGFTLSLAKGLKEMVFRVSTMKTKKKCI